DDQTEAVARRRAFKRRTVAFAQRGSNRARDQEVIGVLLDLMFGDSWCKERMKAGAVTGVQRPFELAHHHIGRVGLSRLRGERRGPEDGARQDEEPSDHWVPDLLDAN